MLYCLCLHVLMMFDCGVVVAGLSVVVGLCVVVVDDVVVVVRDCWFGCA